jgi:hypothetical protein
MAIIAIVAITDAMTSARLDFRFRNFRQFTLRASIRILGAHVIHASMSVLRTHRGRAQYLQPIDTVERSYV